MRLPGGRCTGAVALGALCLLLVPRVAEAQWSTAPLDRGSGEWAAWPMVAAAEAGVSHASQWDVTSALDLLQQSEGGSGWRKGAVVGGLIGGAVGLLAFLVIDSLPCDSCSGVSDSFAAGTGPEFVISFAVIGAGIGALVAR